VKTNLLTGQLVRLAAMNPETDADSIARWSFDSEFWRLSHPGPAQPRLSKQVKDWLNDRPVDSHWFAIRTLSEDRLIGDVGLFAVKWNHGDAFMGISIGERDYWGKGYGTDALRVLLRYAFTELNLHRVSLSSLEGNTRATRSYEKAGFVPEGRMRQATHYEGRRFDEVFMGVLRSEWLKNNAQ
jgi:RimJ/RimL family protein N-acetyltransferase